MVIPKDFLIMESPKIGEMGEKLVNDKHYKFDEITMSQLRKFLSHVNSLQNKYEAQKGSFDKSEIDYLRIKLAYQTGRSKEDRKTRTKLLQPLYDELDPIIKTIKNADDFSRFARLIESLVAYHKYYYGGNE